MSVNYGYKRLTTGAHYGGRDWIAQRVTAALIVLFTVAGLATGCVGLAVTMPLIGHASWHAYRDLVVHRD